MCGRYDIERLWQEYCKSAYFNWEDPPLPFENPMQPMRFNRDKLGRSANEVR